MEAIRESVKKKSKNKKKKSESITFPTLWKN
jgi:hypothetical protein